MYVCTCVCMFTYVYTCMYVHACMYVGMYLGLYMYIWGWRSGPSPPKKLQKLKNKLNVVSPAGRSWSAFSDIWMISPLKTNKQKMSSELQSWAPSYIIFWIRA